MATTQGPVETTASGDLFVRNATGLVRDISPRSAFWMQFLGCHPVQPLAYGIFFAFALFPGGNFLLGCVLAIPIVAAYAYSFGLLSSMLPRTGGDYLFVTRVISPVIGIMSSFCQVVALLMSLSFFGSAVVTLGVAPGVEAIGLVGHYPKLVSWGATISTDKWWIWGIGTACFVLGALIYVGGWRRTLRRQSVIVGVVTLGLVVSGVIALVLSHSTFINDFNSFAKPYTGLKDSYGATLTAAHKAGVNTSPGFSFGHTLPITVVIVTLLAFSWFASYAGSELRRAKASVQANMMAFSGAIAVLLVILFGVLFIHTFGNGFLIGANASSGLPKGVSASPTYFFLLSAAVGSTPLAIFLVITYLLFWVGATYYLFVPLTRTLFAYAFDGLLPKKITAVDSRTHTPFWAIGVAFVLLEAFFIWSLQLNNFVQVLTYASLVQFISMGLVGVAAAIVPWRKPELYSAGATQRRFLGLPVVSIAGGAAVLSSVLIYVLYFHYAAEFGLSDKTKFVLFAVGVMVVSVIFLYGVRAIRHRQGIRQELVYAEIPPE
jgi:basic amino acid/polyamine antiporter, APA family